VGFWLFEIKNQKEIKIRKLPKKKSRRPTCLTDFPDSVKLDTGQKSWKAQTAKTA
jgi:hypothetical protein